MKYSILFILYFISTMAFATIENKQFSAKGLEKLNFKNMSGNVMITVSKDNKAYVTAKKIKFEKNCSLEISRTDKDLVIKVEKEGWFSTGYCKVNFDIKVPKAIAMKLKNGSGDLSVNGTKGNINFRLGSGDTTVNAEVNELDGMSGSGTINVNGTIGNVDLKTGSGSINVAGLLGSAALKSGSGDMSLSYKSAPKSGDLDIKTGSGDVTVYFPATMKILTNYMSGSGRLYNELGDSSDALFEVSMKAGSGDLNIKKLKSN